MTWRLGNNTLVSTDGAGINFVQHLPQLVAKVFHVLETVSWFFRERLVDDLLEMRRNSARTQLRNRSRGIVQHCVTHVDRSLASKRPSAGQHLVQQDAA